MVDTVRSLSALQALLADNTAGDIGAQDIRDFLVSVARATIADSILPWASVTTLGSDAATISVTGIPAVPGATILASVNGRSDIVATNDVVQIQVSTAATFDTGNSYLYIAQETADNADNLKTDTADAEVDGVRLGRTAMPGASAQANVAGGGEFWIPNYAGTVFYKSIHSVAGHADDAATNGVYRIGFSSGFWKNTAAIDGVQVFLDGGDNFVTGSTLRVAVL